MDTQPSVLFRRITAHTRSSGAFLIAFLWGLAEATLFFLIPDIYLGFVALFNGRKGLLSTAWAVAGALVGGSIMFILSADSPQFMNQVLIRIPLINQQMLDSVAGAIHLTGVEALVTGPLQGIPYKVYAVQAGQQGLPIFQFLLVSIFARLERILPVALAGAAAGSIFRNFIQRHTGLVVGAYIVLWLAIYTWYFLQFQ